MSWIIVIYVLVMPALSFCLSVAALVLCYKTIKVLEGKKYRYIRPVREERIDDMDILTYEVGLPQSTSHDVVEGRLTVNRTPHEPLLAEEVIIVAKDAVKALVQIPQDSKADLSYVVVDDAGNLSEPILASFVATDTFAPILEGELTVVAVAEETIPDTPEVPTEPEPEAPTEPETPAEPAPNPAEPEFEEPDTQPTPPVG